MAPLQWLRQFLIGSPIDRVEKALNELSNYQRWASHFIYRYEVNLPKREIELVLQDFRHELEYNQTRNVENVLLLMLNGYTRFEAYRKLRLYDTVY